MSIYVEVDGETVIVSGDRIEQGRLASSPIPAEVVQRQVDEARSRARAGRPVGTVTVTQVAGRFVERRPPRAVEAVLWTGDNWPVVEGWLRGRVESAKLDPDDATQVVVWDDDARMRCRAGTWLVQGGGGEVSTCPADRFAKTYAPAPLEGERRREFSPLDERDVPVAEKAFGAGRTAGALAATDALEPMIRGLARAAAFLERADGESAILETDGSPMWDDACRTALEEAKLRGFYPPGASLGVPLTASFLGELVAWRRWARGILREPESAALPDEQIRRKLAAVIEAPSVISAEQLGGFVTLGEARPMLPSNKYLTAIDLDLLTRDVLDARDNVHSDDGTFERVRRVLAARVVRSRPAVEPGDPVVEACARVGYEVYRTGFDDPGKLEWDAADEDDRRVARDMVVVVLSGVSPAQEHARWLARKADEGWSLGELDEDRKLHPNMVPYEQLPDGQRLLDQLFVAAVLATALAVDELEEAYSVPVLRIRGDLPPDQFAEFKRDWERQVASAYAWKTPIVDAPAVVRRRPSPYTRSGLTAFVDGQVDSMLERPETWGSLREVELQVLLMLEVRAFVDAGQGGVDAVAASYQSFVASKIGDTVSAEALATQLDDLGRAGEFVGLMGEFVVACRGVLAGTRADEP